MILSLQHVHLTGISRETLISIPVHTECADIEAGDPGARPHHLREKDRIVHYALIARNALPSVVKAARRGRDGGEAPRKYSQADLVSDNFPRSIHFSARRRFLAARALGAVAFQRHVGVTMMTSTWFIDRIWILFGYSRVTESTIFNYKTII